ncbi:MAG TPA: thymidylate synthase [Candidatus Bathyarchaeia archaeon]|nr:thymidylate synthase [Candidatus Bathyarchaeia archaeon]
MKKKWPAYFNERLWLVNPSQGYIGIVTCWTAKEQVAPRMPSQVALVGQLYTKAGIEFIIRNLWANPQISSLVVCGQDLTGSGQALVEFFERGTIDNQRPFFEEQIPRRDLVLIRKKVGLVSLLGEVDPDLIARKVAGLKFSPPFASRPKFFPQSQLMEAFPSEPSLFRVEAKTIGEAWLQILGLILKFGRRLPRIYVYGGYERVLLNLSVLITDEDIKKPKLWPYFQFNKEQLKTYFRSFFSPERGGEAYTYGERLFAYPSEGNVVDQVTKMANKLKSFPYNKGALAVLWQPAIDNFPIRKPWRTPCLTLVQGICLGDELCLTAFFRANDMFAAWPQNCFALRKLQTEIAKKIGKKIGALTTISHTAFIDEADLPKAQKVINDNQPLFCQLDPRGNIAVTVEGKIIVSRHFSPEGKLLAEYRQNGLVPKAALKLERKLISSQVISRVDHALDIGEHLGRAEDAVKLGLKFEQDRQLKK